MSSLRGGCVVAWLERWGARCLRERQPEIYLQLLLHVGATDILRTYSGSGGYWLYVQAILDSFFSASERAEMCAELIAERVFVNDPGFSPFLMQARAEIRCREMVSRIERTARIRTSLRSLT